MQDVHCIAMSNCRILCRYPYPYPYSYRYPPAIALRVRRLWLAPRKHIRTPHGTSRARASSCQNPVIPVLPSALFTTAFFEIPSQSPPSHPIPDPISKPDTDPARSTRQPCVPDQGFKRTGNHSLPLRGNKGEMPDTTIAKWAGVSLTAGDCGGGCIGVRARLALSVDMPGPPHPLPLSPHLALPWRSSRFGRAHNS